MPGARIATGGARRLRHRAPLASAILGLVALALLSSSPATAGWDEGLAAYEAADFPAALREWQPLAEQGDARAQEMLGYMYDLGEGVPENDGVAAAWYLRAANQGSADARINLGLLYAAACPGTTCAPTCGSNSPPSPATRASAKWPGRRGTKLPRG